MARRITVDPVTRIEGHLRIDCEIDKGKVKNAWASGQMLRGIENILKGRDPRDAWIYTQRFCGVCTTVHAIASVRSVENALDMEVPLNAQFIRNMIIAAHGIHDHIVHFYHLSALDWVDVVSGLKGNVKNTSKLAESLSSWDKNGVKELQAVKDRIAGFVNTGQLGIFENGYWGHPAMKLPPDVNLLATAHYLQAFEYQRKANQITTILGSKTPHIQNLAVGGVSNPINPDSQSALNFERLYYVKSLIDELGSFIKNVYMIDVAAVAAFYPEWLSYGPGVMNYLSVPDFPEDTAGTKFGTPGGYIPNGDISKYMPLKKFGDEKFKTGVKESIKHSWYDGDWTRNPWEEDTEPNYTEFQDNGKYSWVKAPSFKNKPAQVGPLANVLAMYAAGHKETREYAHGMLANVNAIGKHNAGLEVLHSTLGRHAARSIRCAVLYSQLKRNYDLLIKNISSGDMETFNKPVFPKGEQRGFGFHEAPRGNLSHWIVINDGKIKNYQAVVPTTWNASPRNQDDAMGPYESSLINNPIADEKRPLEVLRTVHSFDPCLACAIHVHDNKRKDISRVSAW